LETIKEACDSKLVKSNCFFQIMKQSVDVGAIVDEFESQFDAKQAEDGKRKKKHE